MGQMTVSRAILKTRYPVPGTSRYLLVPHDYRYPITGIARTLMKFSPYVAPSLQFLWGKFHPEILRGYRLRSDQPHDCREANVRQRWPHDDLLIYWRETCYSWHQIYNIYKAGFLFRLHILQMGTFGCKIVVYIMYNYLLSRHTPSHQYSCVCLQFYDTEMQSSRPRSWSRGASRTKTQVLVLVLVLKPRVSVLVLVLR